MWCFVNGWLVVSDPRLCCLHLQGQESEKNLVVPEDEGQCSFDTSDNSHHAASHPWRLESSTNTCLTTVSRWENPPRWPTMLIQHTNPWYSWLPQKILLLTEDVHRFLKKIRSSLKISGGMQERSWLRHCATGCKVVGLIPDGVTGIFHWHNPSGRTMALGLTQPLTEMSTTNISWG